MTDTEKVLKAIQKIKDRMDEVVEKDKNDQIAELAKEAWKSASELDPQKAYWITWTPTPASVGYVTTTSTYPQNAQWEWITYDQNSYSSGATYVTSNTNTTR